MACLHSAIALHNCHLDMTFCSTGVTIKIIKNCFCIRCLGFVEIFPVNLPMALPPQCDRYAKAFTWRPLPLASLSPTIQSPQTRPPCNRCTAIPLALSSAPHAPVASPPPMHYNPRQRTACVTPLLAWGMSGFRPAMTHRQRMLRRRKVADGG